MANGKTTKVLHFNVLFEQDEDGYFVASVPNFDGCYTQGKTLEVAKERVKEVIKLCLKDKEELLRATKQSSKPSFIGMESITIQYA